MTKLRSSYGLWGLALVLSLLTPVGAVAQTGTIEMDEPEDDFEIEVDAQPSPAEAPPARPSPPSASPPAASPPAASPPAASPPAASPPASGTPAPGATAASTPRSESSFEAQRAEIAELRARLEALEAAQGDVGPEEVTEAQAERSAPLPTDGGADADADAPAIGEKDFVEGVKVQGWMQVQYGQSQLSQDQLQQGGVPLNQNRFQVRRARLRVTGEWDHFVFDMEVDGSTTNGPVFGLRHTTVGLIFRNPDATLPPYFEVTGGLTEVPLGYQNLVSPRDRPWMERTQGSISFFGYTPLDVGAKVRGGLGPFRYDIAVLGGTPYDNRHQFLRGDPQHTPDVVGRIGAQTAPSDRFEFAGGASFLTGKGFHPGQDATKPRLQWNDTNQNGVFDPNEVVAIPGRAATPSFTFSHWAFNVDMRTAFRSGLGWTRLYAEATVAQNLDRTNFVADPIASGNNIRELSAYVAATQDVRDFGYFGVRYDYYDPNSDFLVQRRGIAVPTNAGIHTISPLVAVELNGGDTRVYQARLTFQYDLILDHLGRNSAGVPVDMRNNQWTIRLQGAWR